MLGQSGCFAWLQHWICAPTQTIAGVLGLYEQLTPTIKRCTQFTIQEQHRVTSQVGCVGDSRLRTCYQGALLWPCLNTCRDNVALKVYFFEMARELGIIDKVPPHELLINLRILISKSSVSIEICSVALLQSHII